MNPREGVRVACIFVANLMLCSAAHAAPIFRAYLASDGNDANTCTLTAPCRLLPAALAAVASGGEIWMLDSANYNTGQVNITKSVTILAVPGALGSVVATGGGDAINIDAADVKVTLRNLVIVHLTGSQHGINFMQGAQLNVAECEIANVLLGIAATAPNSKVTVKNTILRNTGSYGFFAAGPVVALLDGVHISDNFSSGVYVGDNARVTVSNSALSGNENAVYVNAASETIRVVIERSVLTGGVNGIFARTVQASGVVEVTASHNAVTHNTGAGVVVSESASSSTTVVADGNTVTENGTGFLFSAGTPTIYTRSNNTLKFNGLDVSGGGLTPLAAQ